MLLRMIQPALTRPLPSIILQQYVLILTVEPCPSSDYLVSTTAELLPDVK